MAPPWIVSGGVVAASGSLRRRSSTLLPLPPWRRPYSLSHHGGSGGVVGRSDGMVPGSGSLRRRSSTLLPPLPTARIWWVRGQRLWIQPPPLPPRLAIAGSGNGGFGLLTGSMGQWMGSAGLSMGFFFFFFYFFI